MKRSLRVALPLLLALGGLAALPLTTACAGPSPLAQPAPGPSWTDPTVSSLEVSGGVQSGAMGDIHAFEGAATHHEGSYYGSGASVRLDSEGADWWVMSRLDISGDLAGVAFEPGAHHVYTSGISDDPGDSTNVTVTGCSGPEYNNYTFDTQASTVEIDVSAEGPGVRRVDYITNYDGQITRGSFAYRIPSAPGTTGVDGRGI